MHDIQLIFGPRYPDQIGGETLIHETPSEFSVEVCWPDGEEIRCRKFTIAAQTHEEAAHHVLSQARRRTSSRAEVVDVQCHSLDCGPESRTNPAETSS